MTEANGRQSEYPIDPLFLNRWSPRAFTDEVISETDLLTMLDAAHWAASAYNVQPWRFLYARRSTPSWERFLGLLNPFNQSWAQNASALVVLVSAKTTRPPGTEQDVPSHSHSMDSGAAAGNFALQATIMGWHVHGMIGIDMERIVTELNVPPGFRVEAAYAVGRRGDKAMLPESLQAREMPNARLPLAEIAIEGGFKA